MARAVNTVSVASSSPRRLRRRAAARRFGPAARGRTARGRSSAAGLREELVRHELPEQRQIKRALRRGRPSTSQRSRPPDARSAARSAGALPGRCRTRRLVRAARGHQSRCRCRRCSAARGASRQRRMRSANGTAALLPSRRHVARAEVRDHVVPVRSAIVAGSPSWSVSRAPPAGRMCRRCGRASRQRRRPDRGRHPG
jgi:hypothetical protein